MHPGPVPGAPPAAGSSRPCRQRVDDPGARGFEKEGHRLLGLCSRGVLRFRTPAHLAAHQPSAQAWARAAPSWSCAILPLPVFRTRRSAARSPPSPKGTDRPGPRGASLSRRRRQTRWLSRRAQAGNRRRWRHADRGDGPARERKRELDDGGPCVNVSCCQKLGFTAVAAPGPMHRTVPQGRGGAGLRS